MVIILLTTRGRIYEHFSKGFCKVYILISSLTKFEKTLKHKFLFIGSGYSFFESSIVLVSTVCA